jgi:hypothetical protein
MKKQEIEKAKWMEWLLDDKNTPAIERWKTKWMHPDKWHHRSWLGWDDDMGVKPYNGLVPNAAPPASNPLTLYVFHSTQAQQLDRELLELSPRHYEAKETVLLGRLREHATLALFEVWTWRKTNPKHRLSEFYKDLASYYKRRESVQGKDDSKILTAFRDLTCKLGRLPSKCELEMKANSLLSESGGISRRLFNKQLNAVGLGGLPERRPMPRVKGALTVRKGKRFS